MPGSYVIHLDADRRRVRDSLLEQLEAEIAARGLGEVDAVMDAGGCEKVLWLTHAAQDEAQAERDVRPGLEELLAELGLAEIASLEWVEESPDEDEDEDEG